MSDPQGAQGSPVQMPDYSDHPSYDASKRDWLIYHTRKDIDNAVSLSKDGIPEGGELQDNYLSYLIHAFNKNHEIILTPDIVWFTLACEVARIIDTDPDAYRDKFTTMKKGEGEGRNKDKTLIKIKTDTPQDLTTYLDAIIEKLRGLVPGGLANEFLPKFTTADWISKLAIHAAFADTVRHYYEYMGGQGCQGSAPPPGGIPYVHLEGTRQDWAAVVDGWTNISNRVFDKRDGLLAKYVEEVKDILSRLKGASESVTDAQDWLRQIYSNDGRPSWFNHLIAPTSIKGGLCRLQSIAHVPYYAKFLDGTEKDYILAVGVFSRRLAGNVLAPEFGYVIYNAAAGTS